MSHHKPVSVRSLSVPGERAFYRLAIILMIVGMLHWAREVFLPLALAVLCAFALTPVAGWLERRRFGRVLSALISTFAAISLIAGILLITERQTERLVYDLQGEAYQHNVEQKLAPILDIIHRLDRMEDAVTPEPAPKPAGEPPKPTDPPTPVILKQSGIGAMGWLPSLARPLAEVVTTLLLVSVLTVFMLVQRETTRDRLIGIGHRRQLTSTTRTLDDAANRVGKFLLLQAATNMIMGLIVGVGLSLIGVPYAMLWGVLTAALRFLPYVGIWLSALFPFGLALAVFPGWGQAMLVIALYGGFDLVMSNVVEPLLFGHGTGVSSLALLMAAVFWAFLWGPVGLLLAVPMTVCLVVLGENIPSLTFLRTLLGDAPEVDPDALFFHRAMVGDFDGAMILVGEQSEKPLSEIYEQMFIGALAQAKSERESGDMDEEVERRVNGTIRAALSVALAERRNKLKTSTASHVVIGCAANGAADRIALRMLRDLIVEAQGEMVVVTGAKLSAEIELQRQAGRSMSVCVAAIAPEGLSRAARLCEYVRAKHSGVEVVVGRWGNETNKSSNEKYLVAAGAAVVSWTLAEALKAVMLNESSKPTLQVTAM